MEKNTTMSQSTLYTGFLLSTTPAAATSASADKNQKRISVTSNLIILYPVFAIHFNVRYHVLEDALPCCPSLSQTLQDLQ